MPLSRRDFLTTSAIAAATLPFIGACHKKNEEEPVTTNAPEIIKPQICTHYFCTKFGITQEMIDKILAKAMSRGGSFGDLFFEHSHTGLVRLMDGKVNAATASVQLGMGVRCVNEDKIGYAFTESLELEDMLRAAEAAAAIAPGNAPIEIKPRHDAEIPKRYYDQAINWSTFDLSKAIDMLHTIENKTKAKDPSIIQVTAGLRWHQRTFMVNTSDGINAEDSQPYFGLILTVVMNRNGEIQSSGKSFSEKNSFESITEEKIDALIDKAVSNTDILYQAVKPKGGEWPIVLAAGDSGILLHEAIGHGLEADLNRNNHSIYATKMNQRVASDEVTIGDSGLVDNSRGALNIDDEGTVGQDTILVENGILKSYLHDKISAGYYKVNPTGNGRRESYQFYPIPRMRVTYMKNGTHERDELFEGIKYGVFCENFTNGQVDIGQGDYTFYVKNGFLIEDGKLTRPIKDINIIGNGPDTLSKITMVANDQSINNGFGMCGKKGQGVPVSFGMPSVRVSAITVGGE